MKPASRIVNYLLVLVFLALLLQRVPLWIANFRSEGQPAPAIVVRLLDGSSLSLPSPEPLVLVFWASWCGPCRVELARLQRLVDQGALSKRRVLAVNWGEEPGLVASHWREKGYTFPVALDPVGEVAKAFGVQATPTVVVIQRGGKVEWQTTGLSPSLEIRLRRL